MANRTIDLVGVTTQGAIFANDSPSSNATLAFSGQFHHTLGSGNKSLTLQGSNVGANRFNAIISDSPGAGGGIHRSSLEG